MLITTDFLTHSRYGKERVTGMACSYSISANEWHIGYMPLRLAKSASCSVGMIIHVCGGISPSGNGIPETNKHYEYDVSASLWLRKASMRNARSGHVMEVVQNTLYVFGGENLDRNVETVESYDCLSNQWTVIQNATFSGTMSSSFVVDGGIYITGGVTKDQNSTAFSSDGIVRYDINSQSIDEEDDALESWEASHFSAMMVLPQLLYEGQCYF